MSRLRFALSSAIVAIAASGAARAEPLVFPLAEALALGQSAHAGQTAFVALLETVFADIRIEPAAPLSRSDDPFRWAVAGSFGGDGANPRPGAIFGCARYGLATRDLFAEHGFAQPETFSLMGEVLPLSDDAEVWPDTAVARLHCIFIWDDAETVMILPEAEASRGLGTVYETVGTDVDGAVFAQLLGEQGFRLFGQNGPGDSVVWQESGDVILTNGHQQVSFRAFLIGGAV